VSEEHFNRFKSYHDKHKEIRILKEHFESNFKLNIIGSNIKDTKEVKGKEEAKQKEETKQGKSAVTAKLGGAFGANLGLKNQTKGASSVNVVGAGVANLLGGKADKETVRAPKEEKKGTLMDFQITFFPDKKMDDIGYYKTLHVFETTSWVSIGFKPKAKDLKTIIEDLN
jgi:hypothetical protein